MINIKIVVVSFFMLFIFLSCSSEKKINTQNLLNTCVEKTVNTMNTLEFPDKYPRYIDGGEKIWKTVGVRDWTSGFWPGTLWYAYEYSGNEDIKKQAERFTNPLKIIAQTSAENHDIGFIMYSSFGNGYRLTGNEEYKNILLRAADTLATLYNPKVGTLLSWPKKLKEYGHNTIIDNMMNLELLYWAAKNGGDKHLHEIAETHAEVTMKNLIRSDNSIFHVGCFDAESGKFVKGITNQGYADNSMWARGQSWGIYGFAISYRETGREDFKEASVKLADHFLNRLPKDGIPYWDFDDPKIPNAPKDASAAAVAACGMLELSNLLTDNNLKSKYKNAAIRLIKNLSSNNYLSKNRNQAILLHSTGNYPKHSEIDASINYADYYYIEALLRLRKSINNSIK